MEADGKLSATSPWLPAGAGKPSTRARLDDGRRHSSPTTAAAAPVAENTSFHQVSLLKLIQK